MRVRALVTAVLAATSFTLAAQEVPRRPRIPAEPSELLTHSPLASCRTAEVRPAARVSRSLRAATWNIRAARSAPVEEIAVELRALAPDIVALQEVDVRARRTGFIDQPVALAEALGLHYAFAASIKWDGGDYGLAVLSRWPLAEVRRHRLDASEAGEPRIVLEVVACVDGRPLRLFNHHADGRAASRESGLAALRELAGAVVGEGVVVLGDFNASADAPGVRGLVDSGLVDLGAADDAATTDGGRIDYLLVDRSLLPVSPVVRVFPTEKSDHRAVVADLNW